jgi:hypothetical protein
VLRVNYKTCAGRVQAGARWGRKDSLGKNRAMDGRRAHLWLYESCGNLNARIVFRPMQDGNYRIISTYFRGLGRYNLRIRERN